MSIKFLVAAAATLLTAGPASAAPVFILNDTGGVGVGSQARAGFEAAAARWGSIFADNVVIRLDVGFFSLGAGILGQAGSASSEVSYSDIRYYLSRDKKSAADTSAYASLPYGLTFLTNEAGTCGSKKGCKPVDPASRTLDRDATRDNKFLDVNTSVQKALGIRGDNVSADADISFSTAFTWDFDPSNGITAGAFDFVGIAAHEIGHALGFVSGVDYADFIAFNIGLDQSAWGSVLDLYRYTGTQRDWTIGGAPCLSADAGKTCLGALSTGANYGDGSQASHWKDNLGIGIMDPTAARGEKLLITAADRTAFDIIGWDLATAPVSSLVAWSDGDYARALGFGPSAGIGPAAVPAPGALALLGLGVLALAGRRRTA